MNEAEIAEVMFFMVTVKSRVVAIAEVESQRRISDVLMDGMRLRDSRMSCWELVVHLCSQYMPVCRAPGRAPPLRAAQIGYLGRYRTVQSRWGSYDTPRYSSPLVLVPSRTPWYSSLTCNDYTPRYEHSTVPYSYYLSGYVSFSFIVSLYVSDLLNVTISTRTVSLCCNLTLVATRPL